jgi:4-hydroxythreonine-4-phosphate dehydrogenase
MSKKIRLVITSGEPAGVGPEVSYRAASVFLKKNHDVSISIMGDKQLFPETEVPNLEILNHDLVVPNQFGKPNPLNASYVLGMLDQAYEGCRQHRFDAMVTAPLQKSTINEGQPVGLPLFTGHTEYLAEKANVNRVVMMLCGQPNFDFPELPSQLRVALVTTHLPLHQVSSAINFDSVLDVIRILNHDLKHRFGISNPNIRVAGLNPHAGESGHLGSEEIQTILPAIQAAQAEGINATGPYPGDTIFDLRQLSKTDAILAMYHDQGLAPFKFATFGVGVNVTLGLPVIRTSVDHGTALDLAGKNQADASSMLVALELAYDLAKNSQNKE